MEEFKDIDRLLNSWGFPQYVQKFTDEGVNAEYLHILTESQISILIPEHGPRMKFLAKLKSFLSTKNRTLRPSKPVKKGIGRLKDLSKNDKEHPRGYFQQKLSLKKTSPKKTSILSSDSDTDDVPTENP